MKKTSLFYILLFSAILNSVNTSAQHNHAYNHSASSEVSAMDILNIKGFDEATVIKELTLEMETKSIPASELAGLLRAKKVAHILTQRGVSTESKTSFSETKLRAGPCDNAGFDFANFTNWSGATGKTNIGVWTPGLVNAGNNSAVSNAGSQHTIHTTAGFDPIAIHATTGLPEIPYLAPGGSGVSARLGNSAVSYGMEQLRYPITVTASNTSFTYQYAVVLQEPGHSFGSQPSFNIKVLDQNGVQVPGNCGIYSVDASAAASDTTFKPFDDPSGNNNPNEGGYYKKWTTVSIDLTAYINNTVTIVFETRDCNLGGHFGYAYIDASCSQLQATVNFCPNDNVLFLNAPSGFSSYQWYDNNGVLISAANGGTNDTLVVNNPVLGQVYSVSMFAASGCGSSLTVTLGYSNISVSTTGANASCSTSSDGMAYAVPSNAIPPFTYSWTNVAGTQISTNDSLLNVPAGTYYVTTTSGGGCSRIDTVIIGNSFMTVSTGQTNVSCYGQSDGLAYAVAGGVASPYTYSWVDSVSGSQVSTNDSLINVVAGTYYVTVTAASGCTISDTVVITQPADVNDSLGVTLSFCPGDNEIILYAPHDPDYLGYIWYAGPNANGVVIGTDDSLIIYNPVPGYQYLLEIITPPPTCHIFINTTLNYQAPPVMPDYKVKTNVFTPNGDGKNDYFDLSNFKFVKEFKVEVYNRWGKRVFVSYDMSVHWDGKIEGRIADAGVYFFIARYKQSCDINAPEVESTGFVHVIR